MASTIRNRPEKGTDEYDEIVATLPKEKGWIFQSLVKYNDTWFNPNVIKGMLLAQDQFLARPTDIFLATFPKCGTTWLKALAFATKNPQECFPFLEVFLLQENDKPKLDMSSLPRVFSIHTPYPHLPESVRSSACRIIYLVRDQKDVFVSSWYHMQKVRSQDLPDLRLEECFSMFCEGIYQFGPYWDHARFWNASMESPEKLLILTYEDLQRNPSD